MIKKLLLCQDFSLPSNYKEIALYECTAAKCFSTSSGTSNFHIQCMRATADKYSLSVFIPLLTKAEPRY